MTEDRARLLAEMKGLLEELHQVDVTVPPSEEDIRYYEVVRELSHSLLHASNYVLEG